MAILETTVEIQVAQVRVVAVQVEVGMFKEKKKQTN